METESKQITKDMTISDILAKYPESAGIMQAYGLHCFGCHVNVYESLEGGTLGHGMDESVLNSMIQELNDFVSRKQTEQPASQEQGTITLTQAAADKVLGLMKAQNKENNGLRVEVLRGGCAGYMYNMDFEEQQQAHDMVIEDKGVRMFVDNQSMEHLKGTEIDYVEGLQESGFKINNPNARSSCGCGKSHGV
ncbi:MAG: iron-sulfur cluster assembly accessory protein [Candidatus Aenigmarchaeota archaeon]|nr:iron-sulfur cluster assembly accessory protein [Candidatus Aenigmarchaeota archaeon]